MRSAEEVLYKAHVRGRDTDDCGDIITSVETAIRSSQTVRVRGNLLVIQSNCAVRADEIDSELICVNPPTMGGLTPASQGSNIGAIAGGVVAGVVVLVVLVLIISMLVVRKKSTHKKM